MFVEQPNNEVSVIEEFSLIDNNNINNNSFFCFTHIVSLHITALPESPQVCKETFAHDRIITEDESETFLQWKMFAIFNNVRKLFTGTLKLQSNGPNIQQYGDWYTGC